MIIGVGVDVVDVARFQRALERAPTLGDKLFTPSERGLPIRSLAARFAAKEAVAKALATDGKLQWHDVTIDRRVGSPPVIVATGTVAARAAELGVDTWHLSLTHDGGIATAFVIAERRADPAAAQVVPIPGVRR